MMNGADCGKCGYLTCRCDVIEQREIERLQAENKKLTAELELHRWISVSERVPKSPTQYQCCYAPYGSDLPQMYFATTWSKKKGFFLEDGKQVFPTHWKPIILPQINPKLLKATEPTISPAKGA